MTSLTLRELGEEDAEDDDEADHVGGEHLVDHNDEWSQELDTSVSTAQV